MAVAHSHLVAGRWNDDACHKAHSFVCSRMKCEFLGLPVFPSSFIYDIITLRHSPHVFPAGSVAPPPPTRSPCPDGYVSWYHNCYKLVEQPATWDAAQAACVQEGGNLASVDMSYDQAFLAGVVLNGMDAWIGLRREVVYSVLKKIAQNI